MLPGLKIGWQAFALYIQHSMTWPDHTASQFVFVISQADFQFCIVCLGTCHLQMVRYDKLLNKQITN